MSGHGMGVETGAQAARSRAVAVLRVRSRALAVALLPAAAAVILLAGGSTGHLPGTGWDVARSVVTPVAVLVLLAAAGVALVVARSRPAVSPTVAITEEAAPDLYRMVRDLADRLDVPPPSAIALTPDCDSWLEDRTHPAHDPPPEAEHDDIAGAGEDPPHRSPTAPVLVIGSPFLWWMRVGELRAVLAPVVAGTGPSAHPDIAAARRFVRGLDAAVAVASAPGRGPAYRAVLAGVGWVARLLLRSCRVHAAEMERGVASAAAERAQAVDYGLRILAQEQVGLAYAGWDRLLTRVALPAWRMGRWPSRLNAGVVAALTELSRRDRLAEGFASRLGERPACDLLEEPGMVDEATSLLAARLFHGGPADPDQDWSPVHWADYPEEVVDRKWRADAARLHRVLDTLGVRPAPADDPPGSAAPTLSRVLEHLTTPSAQDRSPTPADATGATPAAQDTAPAAPARAAQPPAAAAPATSDSATSASASTSTSATPAPAASTSATSPPARPGPAGHDPAAPATAPAHIADPASPPPSPSPSPSAPMPSPSLPSAPSAAVADDDEELAPTTPRSAALAARLSAELAREEAAAGTARATRGASAEPGPEAGALWDDRALPLFPLQPRRTPRELLADHITAMVCCAAMDTAGAVPGLDWLDGPVLLVSGERAPDLSPQVLTLIESGDPSALRLWLTRQGIRPEKTVRLV
ncbi:hypothetical protein GCM10009601_34610 [Streptomyces thermospinosisporus]|uniref:Integral membrane protein n=1 Tax=Streptomyces thermospinosisporus TaxID=161482 RepID=A0ABP4JR25_9ACTN